MLHAGVALRALLVPSVLPCGEEVGTRSGILPKNPRVHVRVVVFGKVHCVTSEIVSIVAPLKVSLEVGNRFASPSDYKLISNQTFGDGSDDLDFALSGDYSYSPYALCPAAQPRVIVENFCGRQVLDDIKPVYEGEVGSKKGLLKIYGLGQLGARSSDGGSEGHGQQRAAEKKKTGVKCKKHEECESNYCAQTGIFGKKTE